MHDLSGSMADLQRTTTCIRLHDEHWSSCRALMLLESLGGHRCLKEEGTVYRFLTGVARDQALELVRRKFGWSVADPHDAGPWLPGRRPWGAESRAASVCRALNLGR